MSEPVNLRPLEIIRAEEYLLERPNRLPTAVLNGGMIVKLFARDPEDHLEHTRFWCSDASIYRIKKMGSLLRVNGLYMTEKNRLKKYGLFCDQAGFVVEKVGDQMRESGYFASSELDPFDSKLREFWAQELDVDPLLVTT